MPRTIKLMGGPRSLFTYLMAVIDTAFSKDTDRITRRLYHKAMEGQHHAISL